MPRRQRIENPLYFVILNIIVSALTILTINWFWDKSHPQQVLEIPTPGICITTDPVVLATPLPTIPPEAVHLTIDNVYGAGKLDSEVLVIINQSVGAINLYGWKLDDGRGTTYSFPDLTLHQGGEVQLFSSAGTNTVTKLFWNLGKPVWTSGKSASLRSPEGVVYASYVIP
ncbi:MAG: lamin tail domain-containing protein [Anaerolineaceae bacterium]|nr:lamin tail domain-containing protein [Anaerolineaceae bacterium]MBN2678385.1 lamin tail domain-containing protein [Anaerolineaceae bacterium]